MDAVTYAAASGAAESIATGITSYSVDGLTLKIHCVDGNDLSITFPAPADGASIVGVDINDKGELVCQLSNGDELNAGNVPFVKGEQGEKGDPGEQGPQGEKGEKGDPGESGVTITANGLYTLAVDPDGNLYSIKDENSNIDFEYDSVTGDLYAVMEVTE